MISLNLIVICVAGLAALWLAGRTLERHHDRRAQARRELAMQERAVVAPVSGLADAVQALTAAAEQLQRAAGTAAPARVGERVTVHTKHPDDRTLFGVVVGDYLDRLVLEDAEYVRPVDEGGPASLPGRQDIAVADIAWIDRHGHVTVPDRAEASS